MQEKRPARESRVLSNHEFERLYKAVAVANLEGLLLNSFVTVSWSLAGLTAPSSVRLAQAALQERMNKWFEYQRRDDATFPSLAAVWVNEVGRTMGLHTHYLLHVPYERRGAFGVWIRKSVAKATETSRGVIRETSRGHRLRVTDVQDLGEPWKVNDSADEQWGVLRYIAKGLDPEGLTPVFSASRRRMLAGEYTGLSKLTDEGLVAGPRCGRSKAISEAAVRRWRPEYEGVMEAERRSVGRKSFHYGASFFHTGELKRHLDGLGI